MQSLLHLVKSHALISDTSSSLSVSKVNGRVRIVTGTGTGNGKERLIIPPHAHVWAISTHTEYSTGRCCFVVFSFLGLDKINP